jgi:RNA polymerase sigma-70 factor (ECF subfamily)
MSSQSNHNLANEASIVKRAKTDDQAFEILYNHYFPRIYGYVFKRVGHQQTAEDIVSQTFLKVFVNLPNYSHQGYTFGAWVYKIATNNLIDHYRKSGKTKSVNIESIAEPTDEKRPALHEEVQQGFDRELVNKCINQLPEKYQKIIHLKYFAQMSSKEIAEVLGISSGNARVMLHRALKHFQKIHQKYEKK